MSQPECPHTAVPPAVVTLAPCPPDAAQRAALAELAAADRLELDDYPLLRDVSGRFGTFDRQGAWVPLPPLR